MVDPALTSAISIVPSGAWAVAVSGGADSVAMLLLLRARTDLSLHVVHLDHQTRGADSAGDAQFVAQLAARLSLPITVAQRRSLEATVPNLPSNASARFRMLRLELFAAAVKAHSLSGVLLGHHADDQAETVLHRLLRSSGFAGLAGMSQRAVVGGVLLLRPLLHVRREALRAYLREQSQPWRCDSSNLSPRYLRNRLRRILGAYPAVTDAMLELSRSCAELRRWVRTTAPELPDRFESARLADLPKLLASESARAWLADHGVPRARIDPHVIDRLLEMSRDAASARRVQFPGRVHVRRRRGIISVDSSV